MACYVSHTDDEIQALVQKLIDEDMVRQKAILDLALQFDDACTAKDDLRKADEKCPSQPVENDSLVEEVEPVQPKQKYTRRSKPTKKNDKDFVEPWTIKKEIALCKAFVAKSEDSVEGNGKKAARFWREVAEHFHEEMGEDKRSYDSVNCKWKNRIRPKAKKKGSSSGARSKTSIAGDPSLVEALLSKFTMAATPFFTQRNESSEYLRIKERELEQEERKRQEQRELERIRIAQCEKELDLQQKMFEFQQQQKFEEDLKYYNEDHDHLTGIALSTVLFLKKKSRSVGI
nr:hypothetical protein [Tanacetum cinerariifolium]